MTIDEVGMELKGAVALVTGASSGIGEAISIALVERGVFVTISARREERLQKVAAKIRSMGGRVLVAQGDISSESELIEVFDRSQAHWGRLDILINNAALGISSSILDGNLAEWRSMLETNVLAVAVATREALKRFCPKNGGQIVNIGSTSGHRIPPNSGFYAVTKFAVRALSEITRQELRRFGSPTKIFMISPGRVETNLFSNSPEPKKSSYRDPWELQTLSSNDVANLIIKMLETPANVEIQDIIVRSRGGIND